MPQHGKSLCVARLDLIAEEGVIGAFICVAGLSYCDAGSQSAFQLSTKRPRTQLSGLVALAPDLEETNESLLVSFGFSARSRQFALRHVGRVSLKRDGVTCRAVPPSAFMTKILCCQPSGASSGLASKAMSRPSGDHEALLSDREGVFVRRCMPLPSAFMVHRSNWSPSGRLKSIRIPSGEKPG